MLRWRGRVEEVTTVPPARRALLLDGLEVETGRALTSARARTEAVAELEMTLAELTSAGADTFPAIEPVSLDTEGIRTRTTDASAARRGARRPSGPRL